MAEETKAVVLHGSTIPRLSTVDDYTKLGDILWRSGYFTDVKSAAQAVAKMLAGAEMGFGPMASLSGVYIYGGRPSFMANLIAAAVKRNGYDYHVDKLDNTECRLTFVGRDGKVLGVSEFTTIDATTAELTTGKNAHSWRHFPRNMLFSRAISNGARWYTPDIFGGVTPYTPDELDAVVDGETGEVVTPAESEIPSPNGQAPQQPEPLPKPAPVPQPEPAGELSEYFEKYPPTLTKVKFWNGQAYEEHPADEQITDGKVVYWFSQTFMAQNGDTEEIKKAKPIKAQKHLVGHLKAHFQRENIIDKAHGSMTWKQFTALVSYCWYVMGDKDHGQIDPEFYQDKIVEVLQQAEAIPYGAPTDANAAPDPARTPTAVEIEDRANKLGVDIRTITHMLFTQAAVPYLTDANEHQRQVLWSVLNGVEQGLFKPDDIDGMISNYMLQ